MLGTDEGPPAAEKSCAFPISGELHLNSIKSRARETCEFPVNSIAGKRCRNSLCSLFSIFSHFGKLTLLESHFSQRLPHQQLAVYLAYFLRFASFAFLVPRRTARTCFSQFPEILDSMANLPIFRRFQRGKIGLYRSISGAGDRDQTRNQRLRKPLLYH